MDTLVNLALAYPFWVWLGVGAVFLAIELSTGSGWLLWPAGSAVLVAFVSFSHIGWAWELVLFAGVTVLSAAFGRRFMPRNMQTGPDINDQTLRLVGHHGAAASPFRDGRGRVLVDGKEWLAELDNDVALERGDRVEVTAVEGGARLRVKPA